MMSSLLRWIAGLLFLTLSFILSLRIFGRFVRLRAVRIRPFSVSLYGIVYSDATPVSISSAHLHIALRLPRSFKLTFISATLHDYEYTDPLHHISLSRLDLRFSLCPVIPETFITAHFDDFRVRVYDSKRTPPWLQTLRENLVSTIVNGEHLRVDNFKAQITFSTVGIRGPRVTISDDNDMVEVHPEEKSHDMPGSYKGSGSQDVDEEEAILTLSASQWHIAGLQHRRYEFGSVNAQLRRSWDPHAHRGSFVLIATDSCWMIAPNPPPLTSKAPTSSKARWPIYLLRSLSNPLNILKSLFFPIPILVNTIRDPQSALTLHVPRLDVTFDRFRLRDAKLVQQASDFVKRQYAELEIKEGMDVAGFVQDMVWEGVLAGWNEAL